MDFFPRRHPPKGYTRQQDTLRYKRLITLEKCLALKQRILDDMHSLPITIHYGFQKTYERSKRSLF